MFDADEYQELLADLFPSKYSKKRANARAMGKKGKKSKFEIKSLTPPKKKNKKKMKVESEEESEYEEAEESSATEESVEEYSDYSTEDDELSLGSRNSNFNIVFTIGNKRDDEDYSDDEDYNEEEDSDYSIEEEDYDEEYEEEEEEEEEDCDEEEEERDEEEEERDEEEDCDEEDIDKNKKIKKIVSFTNDEAISKFKAVISGMTKEQRNNEIVKKMIDEFKLCEKDHEKKKNKKTKNVRKKNTSKFKKLLRQNNVMNDTNYFKNKITPSEQELIIQQIEEIKQHSNIDKPYRLALLDSDIPVGYKACAYRKINTLKYMEPGWR